MEKNLKNNNNKNNNNKNNNNENDITKLSVKQIVNLLEKKEISSVELTKAYIKNCEKNREINFLITESFDQALDTAKKVDDIRQKKHSNSELSKLSGIPIVIKDNISTKDIRTTAGSKILEHYIPVYDATVVKRIKNNLLPILGKSNLDEFAMGASNEFSAYGNVKNSIDKKRVPGGSSGGSAVAISSFSSPLAIGSDTGGSIRQPASFTKIVGAKPTYGAVSRYGLIANASSLDQIGPMAKTVEDAGLLSEIIYGYDEMDSTSLKKMSPKGIMDNIKLASDNFNSNKIKGLKIGIIKEILSKTFTKGFQKDVITNFNETIGKLEKKGAEIVEINCPYFEYGLSAYYIIQPAEASSNLARYDSVRYGEIEQRETVEKTMSATRGKFFGSEVKRRIILGTYALSAGYYDAYYGKAQKVRRLIQNDFENAYKKVDVLVSPTCPTTAFKFGEKIDNPLQMYINDILTVMSNLAGSPAISVPSGADSMGLPIGFHIMAPIMKEKRMYYVAQIVEMLNA